ncbi:MAG TPA: prolipoprotein diacylglyceryl transferase [Blastocatellia bacterium]|nr:prolipoprotein diacylglyceryl transferase [Blastocatellia bacterium]
MHPELFRIPYLEITVYTYGVLQATAFLIGLWVAMRHAEQDGMDRARIFNLGVAVIIGSLIGSRLLMVITEWESFRGNWQALFSLQLVQAGGVYYGGFLAGIATALWYARRHALSWWKVADAFAPAVSLGLAIGRLGCFSAGCCWGKPTTHWWGVQFPEAARLFVGTPTAMRLHPTQLYEAAASVLIFLWLLQRRKTRRFPGQLILLYAIVYGAARFLIEFVRDDWRGWVGPLSTSQFIAVVTILAATILYLRLKSRPTAVGGSPADANTHASSAPRPS